jgi:hypothetical protein
MSNRQIQLRKVGSDPWPAWHQWRLVDEDNNIIHEDKTWYQGRGMARRAARRWMKRQVDGKRAWYSI